MSHHLFKFADELSGGAADGMPDSRFNGNELAKGVAEEHEHTDNPVIAKEIAKDHLVEEGPRYYTELEKLDHKLDKQAVTAPTVAISADNILKKDPNYFPSRPLTEKEIKDYERIPGALQHNYVADAAGFRGIMRARKAIQDAIDKKKDKSVTDTVLSHAAQTSGVMLDKIYNSAVRQAENKFYRYGDLVPGLSYEGINALDFMAAMHKATPEMRRAAAERYKRHMRAFQDKLNPDAKPVKDPSLFQIGVAGNMVNVDTDLAGHRFNRKKHPYHYWLNPFTPGPGSHFSDYLYQRSVASLAEADTPEKKMLHLLPFYGAIKGDKKLQDKLRATAHSLNLYPEEAMPEVEKRAAEVVFPYKKPTPHPVFSNFINDSTLTPSQAKDIVRVMESVYPRALKNTRVEMHGAAPKDWSARTWDNKGLTNKDLRNWGHDRDTQFEDKSTDFEDMYLHSPNVVVGRSGNPGILVHELGHAVDFNDFPEDSFVRRRLARYYRDWMPNVVHEHAAWKKGVRGFTEGAAKNKLDPELVLRTLRDVKGTKPIGLGSYWGAGIGSLAGFAGGVAGLFGLNAAGSRRIPIYLPLMTAGLGGLIGNKAGLGIGRAMTDENRLLSEAMREKLINTYAQTYSKINNVPHAQAVEEITQQLNKKKKKPAQEQAA